MAGNVKRKARQKNIEQFGGKKGTLEIFSRDRESWHKLSGWENSRRALKVLREMPEGNEKRSLKGLLELRYTFAKDLEMGRKDPKNYINEIYIAKNMLSELDKDIKRHIEKAKKKPGL